MWSQLMPPHPKTPSALGVGVVICLERGADCLHVVTADATTSQNTVRSCLV